MTVKHNKLQLATITFSISMLLGASTYAMNYWVFFNNDSETSKKTKNKLNTISNNRGRSPLQRRWLIATMNKAIITSPIVLEAPRAKTKPTDEIVTKLPTSSKGTSKTLLTAFQNKKKIKKTQFKPSLNIKTHKRKAMRKKEVTPRKEPHRIRITTVKKSKNKKPAQPFPSLEQSLGIPLY